MPGILRLLDYKSFYFAGIFAKLKKIPDIRKFLGRCRFN